MLLKLQRKVKELERNKQSLWEQLDKKEGAQQEKARVKPRVNPVFIFLPVAFFLSLISACSSKKELAEQISVGRAELDLEKLKVRPTRRLQHLLTGV